MKLVTPPEYVAQATELVNAASRRVSIIAMVIADHPATHDLIEALIEAANRGVDVTVAADIFTYGEVSGSFLPLRYNSIGSRASTSMAKRLRSAGVKFHWLGQGRMTLFNGRTHSKWCVIDDAVFTFGGINLHQDGIENNDYMFTFEDAEIAELLTHEQHRIQRVEKVSQNYASHKKDIDEHSRILFDGGVIGHSLIYKRACELATQASEVTFVSQYCPTGKISRILKTKPYRLYFNRPEQATYLNRFLIWVSTGATGLRTEYKKKRYLHAKFIIFTMPDGTKRAITGSHNFAYTIVLSGTREIALETKDPAIIKQLEAFIHNHVV